MLAVGQKERLLYLVDKWKEDLSIFALMLVLLAVF